MGVLSDHVLTCLQSCQNLLIDSFMPVMCVPIAVAPDALDLLCECDTPCLLSFLAVILTTVSYQVMLHKSVTISMHETASLFCFSRNDLLWH